MNEWRKNVSKITKLTLIKLILKDHILSKAAFFLIQCCCFIIYLIVVAMSLQSKFICLVNYVQSLAPIISNQPTIRTTKTLRSSRTKSLLDCHSTASAGTFWWGNFIFNLKFTRYKKHNLISISIYLEVSVHFYVFNGTVLHGNDSNALLQL